MPTKKQPWLLVLTPDRRPSSKNIDRFGQHARSFISESRSHSTHLTFLTQSSQISLSLSQTERTQDGNSGEGSSAMTGTFNLSWISLEINS
jgi:hypothetical protein